MLYGGGCLEIQYHRLENKRRTISILRQNSRSVEKTKQGTEEDTHEPNSFKLGIETSRLVIEMTKIDNKV